LFKRGNVGIPDPSQASTWEDLAECLRLLHIRADRPSLRTLETRTKHASGELPGTRLKRVPLGRTTISDVLAGQKFPGKAFLLTLVEACGADLQTDRRWEQAWDQLAPRHVTPGRTEAEELRQQLAAARDEAEQLRSQVAAATAEAEQSRASAEAATQTAAEAELKSYDADQHRKQAEAKADQLRQQLAEARVQAGEAAADLRRYLLAARAPASNPPASHAAEAQDGSDTAEQAPPAQPHTALSLADTVKAAHREGFDFGQAVAREAPKLWLEAMLARKPRMPSDLEARLLQGSALPIDALLHDEVRHALRRGFWDAMKSSRAS
jgi:hypothetical protein